MNEKEEDALRQKIWDILVNYDFEIECVDSLVELIEDEITKREIGNASGGER